MKTIVITRPAFSDGETDLVNSLFLEGMERLHLRKPGASEEELAAWLQDIEVNTTDALSCTIAFRWRRNSRWAGCI